MLGLYIHIPFCATRCHYCNFVTTAEHSPELKKRFFKAVSAEIKHACDRYGPLLFDTLYLGGGTPSSLSIPELRQLVGEVHGSFKFSEGYEFTCELNPGDGDESKLKALYEGGVNRISLGCQSFRRRSSGGSGAGIRCAILSGRSQGSVRPVFPISALI